MQLEDYIELFTEGLTHFIFSIKWFVADAHCDLLLVGIFYDPDPCMWAVPLQRAQFSHLVSPSHFFLKGLCPFSTSFMQITLPHLCDEVIAVQLLTGFQFFLFVSHAATISTGL